MRSSFLIALLLAFFMGSSAAHATVDIAIDLSSQRMNVTSSSGSYSWPVSTARAGYVTPRGVYHPQAMYRMTYSRIYNNAPMPHAIFCNGGYAIHGTYSTGQLGSPASHGCVRLAPGNAAALYQMVKAEGARITISGAPPVSRAVAQSSRGKGAKYASGTRGKGTKYARGSHHKGTKYASASSKKRHGGTRSPTQPQPPAQDMFGLFGGG